MVINRMVSKEDYYQVLDLQPDASDKAIKKHYHFLASRWHPEKNHIGRARAEKVFLELSEAYEVISNRRIRRAYDDGGFEAVYKCRNTKYDFSNFSLLDAESVFERFCRGRDPFAILEENDPFFEDEFFELDTHDDFFDDHHSKFFETSTNTKKRFAKSPRSGGVEKSVKTVIVDKDGRRVKKTVTTIINADGSQEIVEEETEEPSAGRFLHD
jgi:DnaJ-class molecular chaperone